MRKKMTKNHVLLIQLASSLMFVTYLIMNRYDGQIPDFVQGMTIGMCMAGFLIVLINHKLLKETTR